MIRGAAVFRGNLVKLCLQFRSEMNFHQFSG
jgi:hypothetical protein